MSDARTKLLEAVPKIDAALEHAATAIEAAAPMSAQAYISEARYFLSRLYSQALRAHASPPAATEPVGEGWGMSDARTKLMEAVVEAAEILEGGTYVIRGRTPEDADTYAHELDHIRDLMKCTAALRAHDASPPAATEPVGEARKIVQIATAFDRGDGFGENGSSYQPAMVTTALCSDGTLWWKHHHESPWHQHQPIPAHVEPAK